MTTAVIKTHAQIGVAATLVNTSTYAQLSNTGVSNTGNDYITGTINSGANNVRMNVAVCDGSYPQLMWHYYDNSLSSPYTQTGYISLGSTYAFDPDVCLLFRLDRFFAIVVYSDPINGFSYLECYEYDVSNNTFNFTTQIGQIIIGNNMATAINIDSDQKDHFAAVWDEASTNSDSHCYIVAGNWSNTFNEPVMCGQWAPGVLLPRLTVGSTTLPLPYKMPDIGVFDESNSVADYIVSVITDNDEVAVYGVIRKNLVCTPSNMPSSLAADYYNSVSGHIHTWPRVARHRHVGTTLQEGYTVVYSDYNTSTSRYNINGHTNFWDSNTSSFINTDNIYTDGSATFPGTSFNLPDISNNTIYKPVVSYERQSGSTNPITSQHFVVAFNGNDGSETYPLAFYAYNSDGKPYTSQGIYNFNQVPIFSSSPENEDIISVAGEQSHVFLYSWWDVANNVMSYKRVTSGNKFKTGIYENMNDVNEVQDICFSRETQSYRMPDYITEATDIRIIDMNGRLINNFRHFNQTVFLDVLNNLKAGMYVTTFTKNNKSFNFKLLIQ